MDQLQNEKVIFSCVVNKKNKYKINQERIFLITEMNFYNIEKTKIQRNVSIHNIQAFTKSIDTKNSTFVLHVDNEYDYEFSCIEKKYGVGFVTKIMNAL